VPGLPRYRSTKQMTELEQNLRVVEAEIRTWLAQILVSPFEFSMRERAGRDIACELTQKYAQVDGSEHLVQEVSYPESKTSEETREEKVPASWWDHLKQDHFPEWLKQRWPVRFRTIVYTHTTRYQTRIERQITQRVRVCPHLELPPDGRRHIQFLINEPNPTYRG